MYWKLNRQKFVESILPTEWIVTKPPLDYGIDLDVEIVEKTFVTGIHFLMAQLKSTGQKYNLPKKALLSIVIGLAIRDIFYGAK